MYLRRHRRTIKNITYENWTLVESRRTANGPRQHTVANLGKLPGLDEQVQVSWESIDDLLEGRPSTTQLRLGNAAQPATPQWREVDVEGLRI
jgi:hypothetical protein